MPAADKDLLVNIAFAVTSKGAEGDSAKILQKVKSGLQELVKSEQKVADASVAQSNRVIAAEKAKLAGMEQAAKKMRGENTGLISSLESVTRRFDKSAAGAGLFGKALSSSKGDVKAAVTQYEKLNKEIGNYNTHISKVKSFNAKGPSAALIKSYNDLAESVRNYSRAVQNMHEPRLRAGNAAKNAPIVPAAPIVRTSNASQIRAESNAYAAGGMKIAQSNAEAVLVGAAAKAAAIQIRTQQTVDSMKMRSEASAMAAAQKVINNQSIAAAKNAQTIAAGAAKAEATLIKGAAEAANIATKAAAKDAAIVSNGAARAAATHTKAAAEGAVHAQRIAQSAQRNQATIATAQARAQGQHVTDAAKSAGIELKSSAKVAAMTTEAAARAAAIQTVTSAKVAAMNRLQAARETNQSMPQQRAGMTELMGNFQLGSLALNSFNSGLNTAINLFMTFARVGISALIIQLTAAIGAVTALSKSFIEINEKFANLEITLKSVFKSQEDARAVTNELAQITAKSPIPIEGLAELAKSIATNPVTRGKLTDQVKEGTLGNDDGYLRRFVTLAEKMVTFRPDKTVTDVVYALREAMAGQFVSLTRRFDISKSTISSLSGKSFDDIKGSPDATFGALETVMNKIISKQAIEEATRQPSKLFENILEQLFIIPLYRIGQVAMPGGKSLYNTLLDPIVEFYKRAQGFTTNRKDASGKIIEGSAPVEQYAAQIGKPLMSILGAVSMFVSRQVESILSKFGLGKEIGGSIFDRVAKLLIQGVEGMNRNLPNWLDRAKTIFESLFSTIMQITKMGLKIVEVASSFIEKYGLIGGIAAVGAAKVGLRFAGGLAAQGAGIVTGAAYNAVVPGVTNAVMRGNSKYAAGPNGSWMIPPVVPSGVGTGFTSLVKSLGGATIALGALAIAAYAVEKAYSAWKNMREAQAEAKAAEADRQKNLARVLVGQGKGEDLIKQLTPLAAIADQKGRGAALSLKGANRNFALLGDTNMTPQAAKIWLDWFKQALPDKDKLQTAAAQSAYDAKSRGNRGLTEKYANMLSDPAKSGNFGDISKVVAAGDTSSAGYNASLREFSDSLPTEARSGNDAIQIAKDLKNTQNVAQQLATMIETFNAKDSIMTQKMLEKKKDFEVALARLEAAPNKNITENIEGVAVPYAEAVAHFKKMIDEATPRTGDLTTSTPEAMEKIKTEITLSVNNMVAAESSRALLALKTAADFFKNAGSDVTAQQAEILVGELVNVFNTLGIDLSTNMIESLRKSLTNPGDSDEVREQAKIEGGKTQAAISDLIMDLIKTRLTDIEAGLKTSFKSAGIPTSKGSGRKQGLDYADNPDVDLYGGLPDLTYEPDLPVIEAPEVAEAAAATKKMGELAQSTGQAARDHRLSGEAMKAASEAQQAAAEKFRDAVSGVGSLLSNVEGLSGAKQGAIAAKQMQEYAGTLGIDPAVFKNVNDLFIDVDQFGQAGLDVIVNKLNAASDMATAVSLRLRQLAATETDLKKKQQYNQDADQFEMIAAQNEDKAKAQELSKDPFGSFAKGFEMEGKRSKDYFTDWTTAGQQSAAAISSAFADAFYEVAMGTKTVGQAFEDLAKSIIQSLIKIAAQKATEALVNLAISAVSMIAGAYAGSGTSTSGTTASSSGATAYATGGPISGGSGTKDDVPIMAMGGEYVIRKDAAESLGRNNLDHINRTGTLPQQFASGGEISARGRRGLQTSSDAGPKSTSAFEINVPVTIEGKNKDSDKTDQAKALSEGIRAAVKEEIVKQKRQGGVLYGK